MRIKQGFQMVTPGNEAALMASAAKAAVAIARGAQPTGASKTGY
jgi:hypothetical protein